ncbi:MAG: DEAD/DEAH box helicase [Janthinobacterium lividum]
MKTFLPINTAVSAGQRNPAGVRLPSSPLSQRAVTGTRGRANQRRAALPWPMPGLLLGDYPMRPERDGDDGFALGSLRYLGARLRAHAGLNERKMQGFIRRVRQLEAQYRNEDRNDAQVAASALARLTTLRALLARDGATEALLAQAFATVTLACRQALGLAPHDCQLFAARVLLDARLAEMATGEGKTLAAGIAATVAALAGVPVHVMTANDYLVGRDAASLAKLAGIFGLRVGAVTQAMDLGARRAAYACDIVYCTAKELAFDYLRDCVAARGNAGPPLLRGLCMAIIDEADAILIDEARVPLVLSRSLAAPLESSGVQPDDAAGAGQPCHYSLAWELACRLQAGTDYSLDATAMRASLSASGRALAAQLMAQSPAHWRTHGHCEELVCLGLVARELLHSGRQYHVRDGKVLLIDETTGRIAEGRAWSGGLQQLVECKEGCAPTPLLRTQAQITYQRLLPRYHFLCGMSGTLGEARRELHAVYGLTVRVVPRHRPGQRRQLPSTVCASAAAQWRAVAARVATLHAAGRPVLVGTDSIGDSRLLAAELRRAGLAHVLLDASQDRHEAAIVARAGLAGAITVATNLAGRGTDIALAPQQVSLGGLHVMSCQQNDAARMDRQLAGRCARQGEAGSVETFITPDGRLTARGGAGAALVRLAAAGLQPGTAAAGGWRGLCAAAGLRLAQAAQERRQCRERIQMLRNDRLAARWFAFGGHKE